MKTGIRPQIDQHLGNDIMDRLRSYNGDIDIGIIMIVLPLVPDGQPGFVTNLEPEAMEEILRSFGKQFTMDFTKSRVVVETPEKKDIN